MIRLDLPAMRAASHHEALMQRHAAVEEQLHVSADSPSASSSYHFNEGHSVPIRNSQTPNLRRALVVRLAGGPMVAPLFTPSTLQAEHSCRSSSDVRQAAAHVVVQTASAEGERPHPLETSREFLDKRGRQATAAAERAKASCTTLANDELRAAGVSRNAKRSLELWHHVSTVTASAAALVDEDPGLHTDLRFAELEHRLTSARQSLSSHARRVQDQLQLDAAGPGQLQLDVGGTSGGYKGIAASAVHPPLGLTLGVAQSPQRALETGGRGGCHCSVTAESLTALRGQLDAQRRQLVAAAADGDDASVGSVANGAAVGMLRGAPSPRSRPLTAR